MISMLVAKPLLPSLVTEEVVVLGFGWRAMDMEL